MISADWLQTLLMQVLRDYGQIKETSRSTVYNDHYVLFFLKGCWKMQTEHFLDLSLKESVNVQFPIWPVDVSVFL